MQTLHSGGGGGASMQRCLHFLCWISGAGRVLHLLSAYVHFWTSIGINFLRASCQPLSSPQAERCGVSASIVCIMNRLAVNEDRGVLRLWGLSVLWISGLCKVKPSLLFIHAPTFNLLLIFLSTGSSWSEPSQLWQKRYVASLATLQGPFLNPDGSNFIFCMTSSRCGD